MLNEKRILKKEVFSSYPLYRKDRIASFLQKELSGFRKKIIVLDDDPTGIQTVHDIYVYTNWDKESIRDGFRNEEQIFFILTNSRSMTASETSKVHAEIARNIVKVAQEEKQDYIIISRSDSTLRGHYPLETQVLKDTIESLGEGRYDGEILMPFFEEGGRYTIDNVHYAEDGDTLIPVAQTEFAADKTFGYSKSNIAEYIEEKSRGEFPKETSISISLNELRNMEIDPIIDKLCRVSGFRKIIVNAISYDDVKVFTVALIRAMNQGKRFLFRTAAAFPKVIGGVKDSPLLTKKALIQENNPAGGLIVIGSHVSKTTRQLEELRKVNDIQFIEFNQHFVVDDVLFEAEQQRVIATVNQIIATGKTAAVFTRRERFDINSGNKEDDLRIAVRISDALTRIVSSLEIKPKFIIAKGGITSSDIGTKALGVKKALVLGQVLPGIPVWLTGKDSKFPDIPYIIFPGNVGTDTALAEIVCRLKD